MSTEIRVMICDDSAIIRRLIKTSLQLEKSLEVVCEAKNGREAIEKFNEAKPDVIVMDIEMPVVDGLQAVKEIRQLDATVPIIMFSSLTSRGAAASLDALAAGATDFATKPTGAGHIQQALESLRRDLIPKLLQWTVGKRASLAEQNAAADNHLASLTSSEFRIAGLDTTTRSAGKSIGQIHAIAIGVSTGGPQALARLLGNLPSPFPIPILIAQHMPPVFTNLLAERLTKQTGHDVHEAVDGEELTGGSVLIAPGDHHLTIERQGNKVVAKLNQDPPEHSCRPSVNPLFCSLADCFGDQALGIVLTGMGQDGARGAKQIKSHGGYVFVQDKASSTVWGMPGQVVQSGCADRILPLDQIADQVNRVIPCNQPIPATTFSH